MANNRKLNKLNIVISIVIAFIAWVYVVYNYSPMKVVKYTNVPIEYVGMEALAEKGLGIENASMETIDVTLNVERKQYADINSEDIVVNADVSGAIEGNNGISLEVIAPYGSTLNKTSASSVTVVAARSNNKDVDLTPVFRNKDGNREPVGENMSYERVSVIGAADNVAKVKYAVIRIDNNSLDGEGVEKSFVLNPVALDENGKEVPFIVVLPSEISLNARMGEVKEVPLELNVNNAEEGIQVDLPKTVIIKGTARYLKSVDKITAEDIDIAGVKEGAVLSINYNLPKGVYIAQASLGKGVVVNKEK